MDDAVKIKLRELVVQHGQGIAEDPRRCGGLLRDTAGSYRKEIAILVAAAEEGVPRDLLNPSFGASTPGLPARLRQRLENERGLSSEAAGWAVDAWAFALGATSQDSVGEQATMGRADLGEQDAVGESRSGRADRQLSWRDNRFLMAAIGVGVVAVAVLVYFFAIRDQSERFTSSRSFASATEIMDELEEGGFVSNITCNQWSANFVSCSVDDGEGAIAIRYTDEEFEGSADAVVGDNWWITGEGDTFERMAEYLGGSES